jgi:hypothetical protein
MRLEQVAQNEKLAEVQDRRGIVIEGSRKHQEIVKATCKKPVKRNPLSRKAFRAIG